MTPSLGSHGISHPTTPDWLMEDMWRTGRDMNLRMTRLETLLQEREEEIRRKLQSIEDCLKKTDSRVGSIEESRLAESHSAEIRRLRTAAVLAACLSLVFQINADQFPQLLKVLGRVATLF